MNRLTLKENQMLKIIERIKEIISPSKTKEKTNIFNQQLLKIDYGKSFKGHEAQLSIDSYNEDDTPKLYLGNKYLAGYVSYSFCNKNQNTIRRVIHTYYLPKWLIQKRLDILTQLQYVKNGRSSYNESILFNVTDKIKINLHGYEVTVEETVTEPGLKMYGHRKNIHYLNELKRLGSYFRKWMKRIDTSTMEFNKTRKDMYQKDGIVFSGELFK
jgi:hypothetical protein